jgi:hypothetical protein
MDEHSEQRAKAICTVMRFVVGKLDPSEETDREFIRCLAAGWRARLMTTFSID